MGGIDQLATTLGIILSIGVLWITHCLNKIAGELRTRNELLREQLDREDHKLESSDVIDL